MFGLKELFQQKLEERDYIVDKDTLKNAVKVLSCYEDRIAKLEALNKRLMMRERSMWSLEDVAGYLDVTNQTIYNMIRDGRIKAYKVGREWRFHPADVEQCIAQGCNIPEVQDG